MHVAKAGAPAYSGQHEPRRIDKPGATGVLERDRGLPPKRLHHRAGGGRREEGLPVHRHSRKSRSSVYAYAKEIDQWRAGRKVVAEPTPARPLWKIPAFAVTMAMCLIMVGNGIRSRWPRLPVRCPRCTTGLERPIPDGGGGRLGGGFSISADGRWLALDRRGDGVDLSIRDMNTGQMKRLAVDAGPLRHFAEWPPGRFSTSSARMSGKKVMTMRTGELRVMATEPGSKPKNPVPKPRHALFRRGRILRRMENRYWRSRSNRTGLANLPGSHSPMAQSSS